MLLFTYWGWRSNVDISGSGASDSSETGKNIFTTLLICQAFLVLFITPAITSGSITIEKEQQTLEMLTMTRLSRASVVIGKLVSAVSFTALLLISSLPLVSICFMLGGVDPAMVISTYLAMLMGSFLIGAVGMMWSSIAKSTTIAVMLTYLTMLGFTIVMSFSIAFYLAAKSSPTSVSGGGAGGMAVLSVAETWCGERFLGIHSIEYAGFGLLSLLAGVLLAAIAMARLETWPDRRAGILRGLTALLILLQAGAGYVWWLDRLYGVQGLGIANAPAVGALCVPLLMLMLIVPIFATGEIYSVEARKFGKYLLWGWTPKGLLRGKLASGIPFLFLVTLLCIGAYALTFVGFGKAKDLMHSASLPGVAVTAPAPVVPPPQALRGYTGTIRNRNGVTVYRNGAVVAINGRPVRSTPTPAPPVAAPAPVPTSVARPGFLGECRRLSAGRDPYAYHGDRLRAGMLVPVHGVQQPLGRGRACLSYPVRGADSAGAQRFDDGQRQSMDYSELCLLEPVFRLRGDDGHKRYGVQRVVSAAPHPGRRADVARDFGLLDGPWFARVPRRFAINCPPCNDQQGYSVRRDGGFGIAAGANFAVLEAILHVEAF